MKKILFILAMICLYSCKKEDVVLQNNTQLVNTSWNVISVYKDYSYIQKNDTVSFSETYYTINSDTTKFSYSLYTNPSGGSLTLKTFMPLNGLTVTAINFNPDVFVKTPIGSSVQLVFKDIYNGDEYITTMRKL